MLKMIIVDDERVSREGLLEFIDWSKYDIEVVGTATNGLEGWNLFSAKAPDIVLTDIKMPLMTGVEMAEKIRAVCRETKIILLSAYGEFSYAQKALKAGVDDYLLKPVDESELRQMVERIMAERLAKNQAEASKKYFLQLLEGEAVICSKLRNCSFQVYILGNRTKYLLRNINDLFWKIEFHEDLTIGIVKYDSHLVDSPNHEYLRKQFDSYYCGKCVEKPEDIKLSYNDAFFTRYVGSFWGLKHLNYKVIEQQRKRFIQQKGQIQQEIIKLAVEFQEAINGQNPSDLGNTVHRMTKYMAQNQGGDPSSIEDMIMFLLQRVVEAFPYLNSNEDSLWNFKMLLQAQEHFENIEGVVLDWMHCISSRVKEHQQLSEITIVQKVIRIVEQQYPQELGLRLLAERVFVSPNYLGTIFKNTTGMYFNDYLTDYRMQKAKELLIACTDKVTKIGEAVGINNHSYFSSLFKKNYGITPKEYRKIYKV